MDAAPSTLSISSQGSLRPPLTVAARPVAGQHAKPLIFIHLYKTGGTTLNRAIEREYPLRRICSIEPNCWNWHYQRILSWPATRLSSIKVFKGHMPFGLHRVIPGSASYMTVLRDPVDRVISDYFFARRFKPHQHHRAALRLSLEDYFVQKHEHNLQSRMLAGGTGDELFPLACDSTVFARARSNLDRHFPVVGLTNRLDETVALIKVLFGWNVFRYRSFRVTANRMPKEKIRPSTAALIRELECFDVSLYSHAVERFEQQIRARCNEVANALFEIRQARASAEVNRRSYFALSIARAITSRLISLM